jgi:hypothetical protein
LRFLPRESVTVQEIVGDEARWSDMEHLQAMTADSVAYLSWLFASGTIAPSGKPVFKSVPKKPPKPIRRPGDIATATGEIGTVNRSEKTLIKAGSLTLDEMDAAIARQTGTRTGIAEEV